MKIKTQIIWFALLCAVALNANALVSAQEKRGEDLKEIAAFLNASEELRNYSANGFTSQFTKELRPIPVELQEELSHNFPQYKFFIAKMTVLIDIPSKKYDLILIADAANEEIEGFVWGNYWTLRPSKSFQSLFKGQQANSDDDAIAKVKTFAKLISFANNDKIGEAKIQDGKVRVELIRGDGVFSIVEVEMNKCLQFDRLTITQPNGEQLKYFV